VIHNSINEDSPFLGKAASPKGAGIFDALYKEREAFAAVRAAVVKQENTKLTFKPELVSQQTAAARSKSPRRSTDAASGANASNRLYEDGARLKDARAKAAAAAIAKEAAGMFVPTLVSQQGGANGCTTVKSNGNSSSSSPTAAAAATVKAVTAAAVTAVTAVVVDDKQVPLPAPPCAELHEIATTAEPPAAAQQEAA
jgi:hypothetical protein